MPSLTTSLEPAKVVRLLVVFAALSMVALFVAVVFRLGSDINDDCAMYLRCGELILRGKVPYVDFIDLNPPLIMYLNVIPAWISSKLHVNDIDCFNVLSYLIAVAFLLLGGATAFGASASEHSSESTAPAAPAADGTTVPGVPPMTRANAAAIMGCMAVFDLAVWGWGQFAQRDHLVALALMQFFLVRVLRYRDTAVAAGSRVLANTQFKLIAAISGAACGLFLCLKPQYALIPAAFEVVLLVRYKQWRNLLAAEMIAAAVFGIAGIAGSMKLLPSAGLDAYIHRWLPIVSKGYSAFDCEPLQFVLLPTFLGIFPLLLIFALMGKKLKKHQKALDVIYALIAWILAAVAAFVVQGKGLMSHCVPILAGVLLLVALQLARCETLKQLLLRIGIVLLCLIPAPLFHYTVAPHYAGADRAILARETAPGSPALYLTAGAQDVFPGVLLMNREQATRYIFLYEINMLKQNRMRAKTDAERDACDKELERVTSEVGADVQAAHPKIVFVQTGVKSDNDADSVYAYLKSVNFFDRFMKDYTRTGSCKGMRSHLAVFMRENAEKQN